MNRNAKIWLVLGGIVLFAGFLRLYHITSTPPGLYPDEAMDGNNALEVIQTGHFQTFYIEDNGREGLYVNTLVFFIEAFGNKPWVVRLPAAIVGILTVVGMYFLGAELFGIFACRMLLAYQLFAHRLSRDHGAVLSCMDALFSHQNIPIGKGMARVDLGHRWRHLFRRWILHLYRLSRDTALAPALYSVL
jgi:hypothetical protein